MGFLDKILRFRQKATTVPPVDTSADVAKTLLRQSGSNYSAASLSRLTSTGQLYQLLSEAIAASSNRYQAYTEYENALSHPYISGAVEVYVDEVCRRDSTSGRSIWIESRDKKLENILMQFLTNIKMEEVIRDWATQLAVYGDFFIRPEGRIGLGVVYIDDDFHPSDIERIDISGRLEGFVYLGQTSGDGSYFQLLPPWSFVHFRLPGPRRRSITSTTLFGSSFGGSYRPTKIRVNGKYSVTTKYGVSLIANALPTYQRLRLASDSLLMTRISRGVLYYMYKVKVSGGTPDQAFSLVKEYIDILKRKTSLDLDQDRWRDRFQEVFAQIEDIYVPVNDDIDVTVEQLGGNPDIRGIVDIEALENQLLAALRVSKAQLGITDELPSVLGGEGSLRRISILFASAVDRLQQALVLGIKRLCQIHLAYLGYNPDPTRFEVKMVENCSALIEELKEILNTSVDISEKLYELLTRIFGEDALDKTEVFNFLNEKILKLQGFDLEKIVKKQPETKQMLMNSSYIGDTFESIPDASNSLNESKDGSRMMGIRFSVSDTGDIVRSEHLFETKRVEVQVKN